jgi:regulator of protease activity HflC (stomatin/prohibitin superfamily)
MPEPFYNNPRVRWGVVTIIVVGLLYYLWSETLLAFARPFLDFFAGRPPVFDGAFLQAALALGFAVIAAIMTRELFYRLVSQFVLPVHTLDERIEAMEHFMRYTSGLPGPIIFVKDGQVVASEAEQRHRRYVPEGVVLVDSASAVVFRTDTHLTRAYGAGVVFTQRGEYPAETFDLRRQRRALSKVKALTRDGIEVSVDVSVTFMLESGEREPFHNLAEPNLPPFVFDKGQALRAAYGKTYRDKTLGEWAELPPLVAADVWRELLIQRDFESLFSASDTSMTLLEGVQYQIKTRLTGTGSSEGSREHEVLAERGIRVLDVRLFNLALSPDVQTKRLERWKDDWKSQAGEIPEEKDQTLKEWRRKGQAEARRDILAQLTQPVREPLEQGKRPWLGMLDMVQSLAEGTRQLLLDPALQQPQHQQNFTDLQKVIQDLELWAKRLRASYPKSEGFK